MPRTITGMYRLRPRKYEGYISSGTFTNYFKSYDGSSTSLSNSVPRNGWTNEYSDHDDTAIGDISTSTYLNTPVNRSSIFSWHGACKGYNAIYKLHKVMNDIPEFDYTITKVTCYAKIAANTDGTNNSDSFYWFSLSSDTGTTYLYKFFDEDIQSSTIEQFSWTDTTRHSMPADSIPANVALCVASSGSGTLSWLRIYEVWFDVEYEYTENETTVKYYDDDGVSVTTNGSDLASNSTYQDYYNAQYPLIATVSKGFVFDGWYLNGTKVSSSLTYTYTFPKTGTDWLYCITKYRKIFVGTEQVKEIYIGTSPVDEIYDGTTKIWGNSPLYGDATSGG